LSDLESIQGKIRSFYYSTLIPVNIIENNKIIYSLPENVNNISSIIKDTYTIEGIFNSDNNNVAATKIKTFYYKNEYDECFAILDLKDNIHIIIGPTLYERIYESHINNIIRLKKLPIKLKAKLINYYDSLIIIDSTRFYYCGKLLENIFTIPITNISYENTNEEPIFRPDDYFANAAHNRDSLFHHPPYFLEQELLTKIRTGNLKDSLILLKEINSLKRSKLSLDTLRSIKNSLICSITLFTRAAIESGVQPEVAFSLSDSLILEIEMMNNPSKLIDCESRAVEQYVKLIREISINNYSSNIKQALSYIYKNLSTRLTLKEIASAIYVHPNYLSSLFKKEVGLNLSDYIMKTRIEESKYYIKYTNTKITEIALFYQFCNQSYYTLAFKKFIGLTPKEYRIKFSSKK
jgi:two-component system response regulator YesN